MIRVVLPALPVASAVGADSTKLLKLAGQLIKAEAWQTAAALHAFRFDPSAIPDPPHTFTTAAGRLSRALHGCWEETAEPVPRTITADGATETTWPRRSGVALFVVDGLLERRHIYIAKNGFITARFPRRQVEVWRYGRYTTGKLGGRTARAVAEALGKETLEFAPALTPLPVHPPCASPYSVLARTLLAMAGAVLAEHAPDLRQRMDTIDFDEPMQDAIANLTVDEVHAY